MEAFDRAIVVEALRYLGVLVVLVVLVVAAFLWSVWTSRRHQETARRLAPSPAESFVRGSRFLSPDEDAVECSRFGSGGDDYRAEVRGRISRPSGR